ncbi:MAG: hypothetical protein N2490_08215 [Ignavibacteria bacterium]|nr:hypothetical protein [Ignavibacteria bacterium]
MSNKSFNIIISVICIFGVLSTFVLLISLDVINNLNDYIACSVNLVVVFLNLIFGLFIMKKTLRKDNKKFIFEFFGSMVLRVILLLVIIFAALTIFKLPVSPFIFSFFGFYLFALIFELSYLSKYIKANFQVETKL